MQETHALEWVESLSHRYQERGIGGKVGLGERPAILVVDMAVAFTTPDHPMGSDLSDTVVR